MRLLDGDVPLAVGDSGEGVAVVGLHGLTATHRYVVMGSRALERGGHRLLLYDARGHGESEPAPAYGYPELTDDLERVMDDADIEQAVIAGVSMGAHTALRFALGHPDRVLALALITPGYDPDSHPAGLELWDALAQALRERGAEGFVEVSAAATAELPERWREVVVESLRQRLAGHRHLAAVADALSAVPRSRPFEAFADLAEIEVPAIVLGSQDEPDPGHPLTLARRYADAIPGARLLVEAPGESPLAWQGGRLSRAIAEVAAQSAPLR